MNYANIYEIISIIPAILTSYFTIIPQFSSQTITIIPSILPDKPGGNSHADNKSTTDI